MWPLFLSIFRTPEPLPVTAPVDGLVLHEWGTFTVVAGRDGAPVPWRPLLGPSDLPDFVYTPDEVDAGTRSGLRTKGSTSIVRMETPVIYLYAPEPTRVSVAVD